MKTGKDQQIRLMAQMSGKSYTELKTYLDSLHPVEAGKGNLVPDYAKKSTILQK